MEGGGPEAVGENDGAGGLRAIVSISSRRPRTGGRPITLEVVAADDAGVDFPGLAEADEGEADSGEIADGAEAFHALAEIVKFGDGEDGVATPGRGRRAASRSGCFRRD